MIKISIALCTYNGANYIGEMLDSILSQTLLPDELIIIDDNSYDSTLDIIKSFSKKASFPVFYQQNKTNIGSTKNFEKAIQRTSGDIIFLADQDDIWENNKIKSMVSHMQEYSLILSFSDGNIITDRKDNSTETLWGNLKFTKRKQKSLKSCIKITKFFLKQDIVTGACLAFSNTLKEHVLPIDNKWIHDAWIAHVAMSLNKISAKSALPLKLIKYRVHPNQQTGIPEQSLRKKVALLRSMKKNNYKLISDKYKCLYNYLVKHTTQNTFFFNLIIEKSFFYFKRDEIINNYRFFKKVRLISFLYIKGYYHKYSNGLKAAIKDSLY